jgi:hypothetical protein
VNKFYGWCDHITTNKGVGQECGLSPLLFDIYVRKITEEWKKNKTDGIQVSNRYVINTVLYADGQVLISKSENGLQILTYHLNSTERKA